MSRASNCLKLWLFVRRIPNFYFLLVLRHKSRIRDPCYFFFFLSLYHEMCFNLSLPVCAPPKLLSSRESLLAMRSIASFKFGIFIFFNRVVDSSPPRGQRINYWQLSVIRWNLLRAKRPLPPPTKCAYTTRVISMPVWQSSVVRRFP